MALDTRYDTSPLGLGKNWVTKRGGLPDFIRAIAHALLRNGHSEAEAIQLAVGAVQNWARGGGHVTAKTRAKAAEALGHWEAMKGSTARSDEDLDRRAASGSYAAGHQFEGNQYMAGGNQPVPPAQAAQQLNCTTAQAYILATAYQGAMNQKVTGQFTVGQLAGMKAALAAAGQSASGAAGGGGGGGSGSASSAAKTVASQAKAAAAAQAAANAKAKTAAAHAGSSTLSTNTQATAASTSKANGINGLPADQRNALSSGVPPAGYKWTTDSNGNSTLTQVTAPSTTAANAKAGTVSMATSSNATAASQAKASAINKLTPDQRTALSSQTPPAGFAWTKGTDGSPQLTQVTAPSTAAATAAAAKAAATASAKAATAAGTAAKFKAAADFNSALPISKTSQSTADAINKLPPAERAIYQTQKAPPAGFMWSGGSLVPSKRSDGDAIETRDMIGEDTPDGAGALLPVGPSKKQDSEILDTLEHHRFVGSDLSACQKCGEPVTAAIHRPAPTSLRHAGVGGHEKVTSGHIKGNFHRHLQAAKAQSASDQGKIEPGLEAAMKDHFAKQRKAVISRLTGKRGKTMLKRAAQPPQGGLVPPPVPFAATPAAAGATAAAVDPSAVFDPVFWANALEQTLAQHYALAAEVAGNRVRSQVAAVPNLDDRNSLQHVGDILAIRAQREAAGITDTTRAAIYAAIQKGVVEGEGITELTANVNAIFDNADAVRAATIARTEAVGSLNQAAQVYASNLPDGTVGSHTWISHHDDRTRPTHRVADGQTVPTDSPFLVGGWPMLFPGDPAAPPGEVINCRCSQAFLPPDMSMGVGVMSAKNLEGLIPASSLAALSKIQAEQAANRKTLVGATASAAHGK